MKKKLNIIWIDDDSTRKQGAKNLQNRIKQSVLFMDVRQEDEALQNIMNGSKPDLILIDHNLANISSGIFKKGSTVAAYIREKWPDCPIACITAQDTDRIDSQKKSQYEEIFDISKISSFDNTILSIAFGYIHLNDSKPLSTNKILNLMKVPDDDVTRLKSIMPYELKERLNDRGLVFNVSNWIRKTLFKRPGFLYDQLWVATLLGIKETSFHKIENIFNAAKYSGIFSDSSNPRWWKSKVLAILSQKVHNIGLSWVKGRKLPSITKRDFSICYASDEEFPETVAYTDETPDSIQAPMRIQYTIPHPNFENLLFFDEIRMMNTKE